MAIIRLEPLAEGSITEILEIEREANTAPWSEQAFRNELDHPNGIFLVARADGEIAGYGGVWIVVDEAHVTTVAVRESNRRQGIGRRLMNELLSKAVASGATCSTLEVRAGNAAAVQLYESMGFSTVARRRGYYPDNKEDALVMWKYDLNA
jgi:ribosomal-protein-alanine N-acetyltransferase